jgi:hypothetical protein
MTLESVYAKTSTLLARTVSQQEFTSQFYSNRCGELDETGVQKFAQKSDSWLAIP